MTGNSYICGDIHGMYDLLMDKLSKVNFNFNEDILYCVGDLVDRGPDSYKVLQLVKEPWFKTVLGNHEEMIIENFQAPYELSSRQLHYQNGGAWFFELSEEMQEECLQIVKSLPLYLEFEINGKLVGIIHADTCSNDWNQIKRASTTIRGRQHTVWGRTKISSNDSTVIKNIDYVFLGHTITEDVVKLGNCVFIDTGSYAYNKLTIIKLNDAIQ